MTEKKPIFVTRAQIEEAYEAYHNAVTSNRNNEYRFTEYLSDLEMTKVELGRVCEKLRVAECRIEHLIYGPDDLPDGQEGIE